MSDNRTWSGSCKVLAEGGRVAWELAVKGIVGEICQVASSVWGPGEPCDGWDRGAGRLLRAKQASWGPRNGERDQESGKRAVRERSVTGTWAPGRTGALWQTRIQKGREGISQACRGTRTR